MFYELAEICLLDNLPLSSIMYS